MAEPQEDIIIIEDDEAASFDEASQHENISDNNDNDKKKKIIIFSAIAVILLLIIGIVLLFILAPSSEEPISSINFIEEKLDEKKSTPIEPSQLENMIAKANYLYANGSKEKALSLYEKIAIYSEAISQYNLGVAQLKNEQYELALSTFQKAIQNDEKRCVSAINAAVCSLYLKDKDSFKYYIDLAYAYLPSEINSPLYSYYYALINYYNNNYLEALSALKNTTSNNYPEVQKHLKAKIDAFFGNNYDAIEAMEKNLHYKDDFNIALLYARVGDYTLAIQHFEESILKNIEPVRSQLALGLVNIKAGRVTKGSTEIQNVTDMFPQEVYKHYPIKVKLKDSIFNETKAQYHYRNNIQNSEYTTYSKIFYFSPYKVFNANQTISYIRKGNANIYIDNIQSAQEYLKKSASSSNVNLGIAKAIKDALEFKIRTANKKLQKLVEIQPKHSILHYNLALTYAQMGDMINAQKHFIRSYHLDAKNYLSGIFAIMTSQLINKDTTKLKSIISDEIINEEPSEDIDLYKTLLTLTDGNSLQAVDWLDNNYKQRPLYLALSSIIALDLNKPKYAQEISRKLIAMLPHDILPHLMYIDAYYGELKPKEYAKKTLNYLKKQKFHFEDLYYGPYITRYLYIQENLIIGKLFYLRTQLKNVLESTKEYTEDITGALALASLYDKAFEESYTLYNDLIDEYKIRDAKTLYLGAVASTAANHHENAIALLELSKLKNKDFRESRYALGLLYLEINNNEGAVIQLSKVGNNGFSSEYFDFDIDVDKLLFQKQNPKKSLGKVTN
jgi:tetratricopeptide (TPR) repeat protein